MAGEAASCDAMAIAADADRVRMGELSVASSGVVMPATVRVRRLGPAKDGRSARHSCDDTNGSAMSIVVPCGDEDSTLIVPP